MKHYHLVYEVINHELTKNLKYQSNFLHRRGYDLEAAEFFGLGYAPNNRNWFLNLLHKMGLTQQDGIEYGILAESGYPMLVDRLTFPIKNDQGYVVSIAGRLLGSGNPKYLATKNNKLVEKSRLLYNIDKALPYIEEKDEVIFVEGYFHVMRAWQLGAKNVVAVMGTVLQDYHLTRLPAPSVFKFYLDHDAASFKAYKKNVVKLFDYLPVKNNPILGRDFIDTSKVYFSFPDTYGEDLDSFYKDSFTEFEPEWYNWYYPFLDDVKPDAPHRVLKELNIFKRTIGPEQYPVIRDLISSKYSISLALIDTWWKQQ